jgi:hypothetical protein
LEDSKGGMILAILGQKQANRALVKGPKVVHWLDLHHLIFLHQIKLDDNSDVHKMHTNDITNYFN